MFSEHFTIICVFEIVVVLRTDFDENPSEIGAEDHPMKISEFVKKTDHILSS